MFLRRLRGLRVQLLLWTILPLAIVLIVLSLASITRHRQAMTQLATDRDRGLALAEANRLTHEIETKTALLARVASDGRLAQGNLDGLVAGLQESYPAGLALLDAAGAQVTSSAAAWAGDPQARDLAARTAAAGQPQYEVIRLAVRATSDANVIARSILSEARCCLAGVVEGCAEAISANAKDCFGPNNGPRNDAPAAVLPNAGGEFLLLVGVPATAGRVLIAAFPTEGLSLADGGQLGELGVHAAIFVFDAAGRPIHHHPSGLAVDPALLTNLPPLPAEGVGTQRVAAGDLDLLVTYARVAPLGWTLVTAEDARAISSMGMSEVEFLPLVLLFVALTALLAISFGVVNVVRPLQELDRRAARVAWGDFDAVKQPVGVVQEIDELRSTLAQMAERIRAYQTGMRDYLAAITQAQEEERSRLAHELHDETVQAFIALKQRAQMARKALAASADPARPAGRLEELEKLIDGELVNLRRLIGDLRPIYLEDLGFVPALEMLARQTEERHRLAVRLDVAGDIVRLAPDLELAAFRIVQQALANVASHAQAQTVVVSVEFAMDGLGLTIRDDGRGFIPPEQPTDLARQGHFGLMGMHERALLYGGRLIITSAPGSGCTVSAWLPVR